MKFTNFPVITKMVNIRTETPVFLTPKPESNLPDEGRGTIGFEMGLQKQIQF